MTRWERATVTVARAVLVLATVFLVLGAPSIGFVTVVGALNRAEGADASGLRVPVLVDVVLPAGVQGPPDVSLPPPGLGRVAAEIGAAGLGIGPAVVCLLLWFAVVAATVPALVGLYRMSRADPDGRVHDDLPRSTRSLAAKVVIAGFAASVGQTSASVVAARAAGDPAVHWALVPNPAIIGLAAGGLVVLLAAGLARGRRREAEHDLPV